MSYILKRSSRAKYMRLTVRPGGEVVLTAPFESSPSAIHSFLTQHAQWIERAVRRMSGFKALPVAGRKAYLRYKEDARARILKKLSYWNRHYGFTYQRVSVKNTRRIWGSCSRKGNLNFSYAILFLPEELQDYIIVHELCHLKEHNHAAAFWNLVGTTLPNYRELRRELKRYIPPR